MSRRGRTLLRSIRSPVQSLVVGCAAQVMGCSSSHGASSGVVDSGFDSAVAIDDAADSIVDTGSSIEANVTASAGDGPNTCGDAGALDSGTCASTALASSSVLGGSFSASSSGAVYGSTPNQWMAYAFATAGQTAPSFDPTATALSLSATVSGLGSSSSYVGVGLSVDGARCLDTTSYLGITFSVSGDLGACSLSLASIFSQDEPSSADPCRGACVATEGANCVAPSQPVTHTGMFTAPFMSFVGGSPTYAPDTSRLIGFQWRLTNGPDSGAGCTADISISDIQFIQ